MAEAITSLGKFPQAGVRPILLAALDRKSFRHRVAGAAIQSFRDQAHPDGVAPVLGHLRANESSFTTGDFGRALDSLAYLARHLEPAEREETRLFVAGYLDHPKEGLRRAAIGALGSLEDPRSLGALRTFAESGNPRLPETGAAEAAIRKISAERGQADEVKDLRREVLDLQKHLGEVKKQLETLRKQTAPEAGAKTEPEATGEEKPAGDAAKPE